MSNETKEVRNIFRDSSDVDRFLSNMKRMADATLSLLRYNATRKPIITHKDLQAISSDNMNSPMPEKLWDQSPMSIKDIAIHLIPSQEGKELAKRHIHDIRIENNGVRIDCDKVIDARNIHQLEIALEQINNYYAAALPNALEARRENVSIASDPNKPQFKSTTKIKTNNFVR